MMAVPGLRFRHLAVSPDDPVDRWGVEGIATAIDRGSLQHWCRIAGAVRRDPHGSVAADLIEALEIAGSPGVTATLRRVLARACGGEGHEVAQRVRAAIRRSELTAGDFATAVGTSASRLSTYATGAVTPSAALLQRIEREARRRAVFVPAPPIGDDLSQEAGPVA